MASKYQMREKMFSIGDDFWIENEDGDKVYKVNGKALRIRETFVLEDRDGNELLEVQERKLRLHGTMALERDGETVATVRKALISPLRDRFEIELEAGGELKAHGHVLDHEFEVERDGDEIARVSKRWFRVRDTYGIEIADGEDDVLLLGIAVAIERLAGDDEPGRDDG
jgi:uncharacterized protein YxjI